MALVMLHPVKVDVRYASAFVQVCLTFPVAFRLVRLVRQGITSRLAGLS